MRLAGFAVVLCCCWSPLAMWAGQKSTPANEPSRQQMDAVFSDLKSSDAPGAAVLVLHRGQIVFEGAYGLADLNSRAPITPATDFRLASCTKQFTATAIMLLVRDGKLKYDTRLTDVFPDFPAYGKSITIRQLLNHTSGLLDYEDLMEKANGGPLPDDAPQIRDAGVLALLKQQSTTKFAPGTKWDYSNSGYSVLAMVVEKVSGQTFEDFLRARIFTSLGMSNTLAYVKGENQVPNRAFGYTRNGSGAWKPTDQSPTSAVLGDGGVYSNLEDLAKWINSIRRHQLLSAQQFQLAITPAPVPARGPDEHPETYGFGWFLSPYKGHQRMWHYGETVGFRTNVQYFPQDDLAIVVLSNRTDAEPGARGLRLADLWLK